MEVEMGLEALTMVGRTARMICLEIGIVGALARSGFLKLGIGKVSHRQAKYNID